MKYAVLKLACWDDVFLNVETEWTPEETADELGVDVEDLDKIDNETLKDKLYEADENSGFLEDFLHDKIDAYIEIREE